MGLYGYEHRGKVNELISFIDSLPYRNHDYLKENNYSDWSICEIDNLILLIKS